MGKPCREGTGAAKPGKSVDGQGELSEGQSLTCPIPPEAPRTTAFMLGRWWGLVAKLAVSLGSIKLAQSSSLTELEGVGYVLTEERRRLSTKVSESDVCCEIRSVKAGFEKGENVSRTFNRPLRGDGNAGGNENAWPDCPAATENPVDFT